MIEYFRYLKRPAKEVLLECFSDDKVGFEEVSKADKGKGLAGSIEEVLFCFYHTKWMLKKRWDAQKAMTQALGLASCLFAIDLAVFNGGFGPSSKHLVLLRKLVQKVGSLCSCLLHNRTPQSHPLLIPGSKRL